MCGGGTLPFLATASINANCPCVASAVARNVISEPLYQTDRSKDCRPRPNAMDSSGFMFTAACVCLAKDIVNVEGVLTWTVDGKQIDVDPGQAPLIPRGAVHRFDNNGSRDVKARNHASRDRSAVFPGVC